MAVKSEDVLYFGSAEPVDGLIVIADYAHIGVRAGQFF